MILSYIHITAEDININLLLAKHNGKTKVLHKITENGKNKLNLKLKDHSYFLVFVSQ